MLHVGGQPAFCRSAAAAPRARTVLLRLEVFNGFNQRNYLSRGQTTFGDTITVNETFGHLASVGTTATAISPSRTSIRLG